MRRLLGVLLRVILAILVVLVLTAGILAATTPGPREAPEWERLADMPNPRGETAIAVTGGGRLVVAGGIAGIGRTVATVGVYDPAGDRWTSAPDLPARRDHAAAAALGEDVYVTGGAPRATGRGGEVSAWVLRSEADRWESLADMPEDRWGHGMAAVDERLYVVGGQGPSARVLVLEGERWRTAAPLPVQRDHLAVVVVDDEIWAVGGRAGFRNLLDRVDIYDPDADGWRPGPSLPVPMSAMAAGVVDSYLHVVGGEDPGTIRGGIIDRHLRLRLGGDRWEEAPLPIVTVHGVPGGVVDGRLIIPGGSRRQGALSVLGWTGITQAYPAGLS